MYTLKTVDFANITVNHLIVVLRPGYCCCCKFALCFLYYHRLFDVLNAAAFKYSSKTYKKIKIFIVILIIDATVGDLVFLFAKSSIWLMIAVFVTFFMLDVIYCIHMTCMFLSKLYQVAQLMQTTTRLPSMEIDYSYRNDHEATVTDNQGKNGWWFEQLELESKVIGSGCNTKMQTTSSNTKQNQKKNHSWAELEHNSPKNNNKHIQ